MRGYGYRKIGVRINNEAYAGHYLLSGSVEWQRPLVIGGEMTDFEAVTFIDAGAVADKLGDMSVKVGVGVGGRWRSPIGAIQFDLAYGVAVKRLRAHLHGWAFLSDDPDTADPAHPVHVPSRVPDPADPFAPAQPTPPPPPGVRACGAFSSGA